MEGVRDIYSGHYSSSLPSARRENFFKKKYKTGKNFEIGMWERNNEEGKGE